MGSLIWFLACAGKDDDGDDAPGAPVTLPADCSPLPEATGATVSLSPGDDLRAAVAAAEPGDTLLLEDGTYDLSGGDAASNLSFEASDVTLRSAGGDASAVVLDAFADTTEIVSIRGANVTIAEITLQNSHGDAVRVVGTSGARLYGITVLDPGDSAIGIDAWQGAWSDDGVIACSTMRRAVTCASAIEAKQAAGWSVYGNVIEQGGCEDPGIRFWTGSSDTVVERNRVSGGAVGIAMGDIEYGEGDERPYPDQCPDLGQAGHYGGIVRNNFVWGVTLAAIRLEDACGTTVTHNTVLGAPIEWRSSEEPALWNNLGVLSGDNAILGGNSIAIESEMVDPAAGDLHLLAGAAAIDAGVAGHADADIDGEARDGAPDAGADERTP